jgi:hypothetical protein
VDLPRFDSRPALRSRKAGLVVSNGTATESLGTAGPHTSLVAGDISAATTVATLDRALGRSQAIGVALNGIRRRLLDGLDRGADLVSLGLVACGSSG